MTSFCVPAISSCVSAISFCVPVISSCVPAMSSCVPAISSCVPVISLWFMVEGSADHMSNWRSNGSYSLYFITCM